MKHIITRRIELLVLVAGFYLVSYEALDGQLPKKHRAETIRQADDVGVNMAYLLGKCWDHKINYDEMKSDGASNPGGTFATIKYGLERQGVCVKITKDLTINDLRDTLPAILQLVDNRDANKQFFLVYGFNSDSVFYVGGPFLSHGRVPADVFFRSWTGYSLSVVDDCVFDTIDRNLLAWLSCVFGAIVLLSYYYGTSK